MNEKEKRKNDEVEETRPSFYASFFRFYTLPFVVITIFVLLFPQIYYLIGTSLGFLFGSLPCCSFMWLMAYLLLLLIVAILAVIVDIVLIFAIAWGIDNIMAFFRRGKPKREEAV
jgi:hypothetical protein